MTYKEFIQNIIDTRGQWSDDVRYSDRGCEKHHIIPLCILGIKREDALDVNWKHNENVIWLYPSEHYKAHELLADENSDNYELVYAFYYMSHIKDVKDSETYEKAKNLFCKLQSEHLLGRTLPDEHKANIKAGCAKYKGENNPACRPEVRKKISIAKQGDKNQMKDPETAKKVHAYLYKKVICIETGVVYANATAASKILKIKNVGKCCRNVIDTAGGYHWKYFEN